MKKRFENLWNKWKAFWENRRRRSQPVAEARLRKALTVDRMEADPDWLEALRGELLAALERQLEVDRPGFLVCLQREEDGACHLEITVPIAGLRRNTVATGVAAS